tara:strand:- start:984 stop:1736 length:753 start_codon:yes stop_codon:yes gene_type:complete
MALGSVIQGALGNPFGNAVSGPAFGVLNEFIGLMRSDNGYAKNNRFEVILTPPSGSRSQGAPTNTFAPLVGTLIGDGTARTTSLRCETIDMPSRTIDTEPDSNLYGPVRNIAQGYSYPTINAVFQCSSDLKERKFFETWQRQAYDPVTWSMGYYDDYVGTVDIYQLDEQDERRYGIRLVECFPKDVGAIAFNSNPGADIQKINIGFSFRYWQNLTDEAKLPISLLDNLTTLARDTVVRNITANIPAVLRR